MLSHDLTLKINMVHTSDLKTINTDEVKYAADRHEMGKLWTYGPMAERIDYILPIYSAEYTHAHFTYPVVSSNFIIVMMGWRNVPINK